MRLSECKKKKQFSKTMASKIVNTIWDYFIEKKYMI